MKRISVTKLLSCAALLAASFFSAGAHAQIDINTQTKGTLSGSRGGTGAPAPTAFGQTPVWDGTKYAPSWGSSALYSPGLIQFGDSITCGYGLSDYTGDGAPNSAYSWLMKATFGGQYTNYCTSGDTVADQMTKHLFTNVNPQYTNQPTITALLGTNDMNLFAGGTGAMQNFKAQVAAFLQWVTVPQGNRVNTSTCTQTSGTWTTNTLGNVSGVTSAHAGDVLTCSITTYGGPIYIGWRVVDNDAGGTATVKIDGTQVDTLASTGYSGQSINSAHSTTQTIFGNRYSVSAGTHTVVFTSTATGGATGTFGVDWVSTPPKQKNVVGPPRIFWGGIPYKQADHDSAMSASYYTAAQTVVNQYQADGLDAVFVPIRDYVNSGDDMASTTITCPDGVVTAGTGAADEHPNACGEKHIRDGFTAYIQPQTAPGNGATLNTQNTFTADQTIQGNDGSALMITSNDTGSTRFRLGNTTSPRQWQWYLGGSNGGAPGATGFWDETQGASPFWLWPYSVTTYGLGTNANSMIGWGWNVFETALDTAFSRISGGKVALGNGNAGSQVGTFVTGNGITIEPFGSGGWIDIPVSGTQPSGIGDGGPGANAWMAYVAGNGNYFSNALAGDIAYRGHAGQALRLGITNGNSGNSSFDITGSGVTSNVPLAAPTPATSDSSTNVATTAWVKAQGYSTSGASPNTVLNNQANTYTAGSKQTFASSSTTAGEGFSGVSADPSTLVAGDRWWRTDLKRQRVYDGSTPQSLAYLSDLTSSGVQPNQANTFTTGTQKFQTGSPTTVGVVVQGATGATTTPSFVQSNSAYTTNTSTSVAFTSNVTAGHAIVVAEGAYLSSGACSGSTVTDTLGNTYTLVTGTNVHYTHCVFIALNSPGGADTVTVTNGNSFIGVGIHEYANVATASAVDASSVTAGLSSTITTTQTDLIFTSLQINGSSTGSASGYTVRVNDLSQNGTGSQLFTADAQMAAGTITPTWTASGASSGADVIAVALKGGGTPQSVDLQQWQNSSGTVLSAVNSQGQVVLPTTAGNPINAPTAGSLAYNSNTGQPMVYNGTWAALSINGSATVVMPNASTTGTTLNMMAALNASNQNDSSVVINPANNGNGMANIGTKGLMGVCISGCGTTGNATLQFAGQVLWKCDNQTTVGDYVVTSGTAGECHDNGSGENQTSLSATPIGRVLAANSGAGTNSLIELMPVIPQNGYPVSTGFSALIGAVGAGSPFMQAVGRWGTDANGALVGSMQIKLYKDGTTNYTVIDPGNSGVGASGRDFVIDPLTNGYGLPPNEMVRINGSLYNVANTATVSGTKTLDVGTTTGVYVWTLSGNTTLSTPSDDNAGHILYFEIKAPASGGPYTFAWPANFINPPTISLSAGNTSVTAAFMYDGTNYYNLTPTTAVSNVPVVTNTLSGTYTANITAAQQLQAASTGYTGTFRIPYSCEVTTAATTSSTLPSLVFSWKQRDSSVAVTQTVAPSNATGNTVGSTFYSGELVISAKNTSAISYTSTGYASSGATAMAYTCRVALEFVGS